MNKERIFKIIKGVHVSEKASNLEVENQFVFKVAVDANKHEIAEAVSTLFDVKVSKVSTCLVKGKKKVFGRRFGKRSDWKKAYVRLPEGETIDLVMGES